MTLSLVWIAQSGCLGYLFEATFAAHKLHVQLNPLCYLLTKKIALKDSNITREGEKIIHKKIHKLRNEMLHLFSLLIVVFPPTTPFFPIIPYLLTSSWYFDVKEFSSVILQLR